MAATIGQMSGTTAIPLNRMLGNVSLNTTLLPPKMTTISSNHTTAWQHDTNDSLPGIQNWNNTAMQPNCLNCYPEYTTVGPLLITYTYPYSYDYAYYAFLLILLIAALVCIKVFILNFFF